MHADPTLPPTDAPARGPGRSYPFRMVVALTFWAVLIGWLAWLLYSRTYWLQQADAANLREWLDESRVFRKSLPDLVREYVARREAGLPADDPAVDNKREQIAELLKCLAEPTRSYQGYLPLFPDVFALEVSFPGTDWAPVAWESPVPRPRRQNQSEVNVLEYPLLGPNDGRAVLRCEYRLHAFNKRQRDAEAAQYQLLAAVGLVLGAGVPAVAWVYYALQRERRRELHQIHAEQQLEHAEKLALQEKVARQDAEREREEAERAALELKSQLYASIGIMAGSYAHNIKNLLVRPNDLLARCIEADGLSPVQESMLGEVRQTLGTVTERLQQILRTVRRDPSRAELTRIDLNALVEDTRRTWEELAREKWKLTLTADLAPGSLPINGDLSHLQQAVENLVFNARDATFEMRNHQRDVARRNPAADAEARRKALIDAAGWRGRVELRTRCEDDRAVLEVRDNGIGMTADVLARCTQTHFSTKRDNALYEGYNAGMGLGLSFVVVVLEHHGAKLAIESKPLGGALFRVSFPLAPAD
jgi:signal transduction histidine kinase